MSNNSVNIVFMKWGSLYPADYANRLYSMVKGNLTHPFNFYYATDDPAGLHGDITPLPFVADEPGLWNKLKLYQPSFFGLEGGAAIFLDLDIVIVGNIDFLVEQPGEFCIIKNWSRKRMWNSSVLRFRFGEQAHIWDSYVKNKDFVVKNYAGDQEWVYQCVPNPGLWSTSKVVSFKKSCDAKAFRLVNKFSPPRKPLLSALKSMSAECPTDAAIVVFHGHPNPADVMHGPCGYWKRAPFIEQHWK